MVKSFSITSEDGYPTYFSIVVFERWQYTFPRYKQCRYFKTLLITWWSNDEVNEIDCFAHCIWNVLKVWLVDIIQIYLFHQTGICKHGLYMVIYANAFSSLCLCMHRASHLVLDCSKCLHWFLSGQPTLHRLQQPQQPSRSQNLPWLSFAPGWWGEYIVVEQTVMCDNYTIQTK